MSTAATQAAQETILKSENLADDERGIIERLPAGSGMSVLRITSVKGSVRANHYHQYDSHYCYLAKGKIRYVERKIGDDQAPLAEWIITPGQTFFTPPMIVHAMEFLEDSEFYAFTPRTGAQAEYENDVIRVTLIDPNEAKARAEA